MFAKRSSRSTWSTRLLVIALISVVSVVGVAVWIAGPAAAREQPTRPVTADPSSIANPAEPAQPLEPTLTLLGHTDLGGVGYTANVAALGSYAYVGSWHFDEHCPALGVRVVDLTDPTAPRWIATTAQYAGTSAEHVVPRWVSTPSFQGSLLAVGIQRCHAGEEDDTVPAGLALIDVTDPSNPRELGFFDVGSQVGGVHELDVTVRDDRVLALLAVPDAEKLTGVGDFQIVDITDPRHPMRLADWGVVAQLGITEGIGCFHLNYAHSARASADGRRAYVSYWDAGVITLDITDPTAPRVEGRVIDRSFDGNFHSVDETPSGLLLTAEEVGYRARPVPLRVGAQAGARTLSVYGCEASVEVELPTTHALSGPLLDLGAGCVASDAGVSGAIALVDEALEQCKLGEKTQQARASGAQAVVVIQEQNRAILEEEEGPVPLFDEPGELVLPVVAVGRSDGQRLRALARTGPAVVTLPARRPSGGLRIWDVRNPARPVRLSVFRTAHAADYPQGGVGGYTIHNPLSVGRYVLLSWYSDGIRLVDLLDPSRPREVASFVPPAVADPAGLQPTAPLVWGVAQAGELVLASDINGGLYVLRAEGLTVK